MKHKLNEQGYVPIHGWRAMPRFMCGCLEIMTEAQLLRAPNPFDPSDEIVGCPHCREVGDLKWLCDFPGCTRASSSGEPTPEGGYVNRCHEHSLWSFRKRAAQGIEAGTIETRQGLDAKRESPVGNADAPLSNPEHRDD